MNSDQSSPDSVSAALIEILRDDLNVDISRVTPESRLVDDVGLDSVAFAVGMVDHVGQVMPGHKTTVSVTR